MAGIYTLGRQPGSVLRGNIIHDVNDCVYGGWGIYNDQGSAEFLIERNIVFDTNDERYFQNNDSERNVLRNNILAFPGTGNLRRGREDNVIESPALERNIIVGRNGAPFTSRWRTPATFRSDRNLFWDYDYRPADLIFDGISFADWQRRGRDGNSVVADPLFVNAATRDFGLKPDSPALALGFEPIDATRAGLYGDKAWVDLLKRKTFRSVFAESLPQEGRPSQRIISAAFADDFESTPVNSRPRVGKAQECGALGTVQVAAGAGRNGTRGLVFSELPGAAPTFTPSLTYETEWHAGTATIEFDLMVEKNSSDLHLHVGRPPCLRIQGRLRNIQGPSLSKPEVTALIEEIIPATGIHYPIALPNLKAYKYLGHRENDCPHATKASKEILSLPMFPEMTREQIQYVARRVEEFGL